MFTPVLFNMGETSRRWESGLATVTTVLALLALFRNFLPQELIRALHRLSRRLMAYFSSYVYFRISEFTGESSAVEQVYEKAKRYLSGRGTNMAHKMVVSLPRHEATPVLHLVRTCNASFTLHCCISGHCLHISCVRLRMHDAGSCTVTACVKSYNTLVQVLSSLDYGAAGVPRPMLTMAMCLLAAKSLSRLSIISLTLVSSSNYQVSRHGHTTGSFCDMLYTISIRMQKLFCACNLHAFCAG